jgi:ribose transport system ATP-binding protein
MSPPLLHVSRVSKAFAAPVLREIDFSVAAGEVVALTGENGAGKSTLSKIIAGLVAADAGTLQLNGEPYAPGNRTSAERLGVRMVLQELGLIGTLSVAENLLLGQIPSKAGFIRRAEMNRIAREQLSRVGLTAIDPSQPVIDLGIGQQQLVEIARGLMGNVRLLILDEPTAMLTAPEIARLFDQIARLKAQGVGLIYISHRLDELSRIADRIVVLRDGALVVNRHTQELAHDDIVRAMIGHDPHFDEDRPRRSAGTERLRIEHMSRSQQVRDVSLSVHAGEIVGLAGLVGSGRTELLRLIFGADFRDSGNIYLDGSASPIAIRSPMEAVRRGIGLLTEDRKTQGLLLTQSLTANLTLAGLSTVSQQGWINDTQEKNAANVWTQKLRIRARDGDQPVSELSGGNQQKVLLARWLHRDCRVLLLDEPTRGIDIGARADIYGELEVLASSGKGLLVVSSDLRELMMLCDRIAVMSAGALVKVFERGEWSEQTLLEAAFSAYTQGAPHTHSTGTEKLT